jgi:drug/metabolite transporter superfamily protein YnfA
MARLPWLLESSPWCGMTLAVGQQIRALGNVLTARLFFIAAAMEIFGGVAIQFPRTARAGAAALGTIYLIFALLWVPHIVATPKIYDRWGNFFEQFSLVSGAMIVYSSVSSNDSAPAA